MTQRVRAAWLKAVDTLEIADYTLPSLGQEDVCIQVKNVGICGSDVHYWKHGRCGDFILDGPMVIGHESSGIVTAVGANVTHLKIGDCVAMEPGVACGSCEFCETDRYNLCPEMKFFATPPVHGSLADSVIHPAKYCFKLPDCLSLEDGALCEPLSVGVHATRRAGLASGDLVLVLGAGPIGLVTIMVAKAMGAAKIVATDVNSKRLEAALDCGADETISVEGKTPEQTATAVNELLQRRGIKGPDRVFDCCGFENSMETALLSSRPGGTVVLVGMGCSKMSLPMCGSSAREVNIVGSFRYKNTYPECIDLMASGKVCPAKLVTHRFGPLETSAIQQGFETALSGEAIKVMFSL